MSERSVGQLDVVAVGDEVSDRGEDVPVRDDDRPGAGAAAREFEPCELVGVDGGAVELEAGALPSSDRVEQVRRCGPNGRSEIDDDCVVRGLEPDRSSSPCVAAA